MHDGLGEQRRRDVRRDRPLVVRGAQSVRDDDVTHAEAGSDRLREEDVKATCSALERMDPRGRLALVPDEPVGVVLSVEVVTCGEVCDPPAALGAEGAAARVLEGRDRVEEGDVAAPLELRLERIRVETLVVHRQRDRLDTAPAEELQRAVVRRRLDEDAPRAPLQLGRRVEVEALQAAGGDEHGSARRRGAHRGAPATGRTRHRCRTRSPSRRARGPRSRTARRGPGRGSRGTVPRVQTRSAASPSSLPAPHARTHAGTWPRGTSRARHEDMSHDEPRRGRSALRQAAARMPAATKSRYLRAPSGGPPKSSRTSATTTGTRRCERPAIARWLLHAQSSGRWHMPARTGFRATYRASRDAAPPS